LLSGLKHHPDDRQILRMVNTSEWTMQTKLIAAILAGGFLVGLQATAMAQGDMAEHPAVSSPSAAKQNPNAAAQDRDKQSAPSNIEEKTGLPAPGPHDSR
jgi:hypothetical protein